MVTYTRSGKMHCFFLLFLTDSTCGPADTLLPLLMCQYCVFLPQSGVVSALRCTKYYLVPCVLEELPVDEAKVVYIYIYKPVGYHIDNCVDLSYFFFKSAQGEKTQLQV